MYHDSIFTSPSRELTTRVDVFFDKILANAERRSIEASKIVAAAEAERKQELSRTATTVSQKSMRRETFEWDRDEEPRIGSILSSEDKPEPQPRISRQADRKPFKLSESPDTGLFREPPKLPTDDLTSETLDFGGYNPSFEPRKATNSAIAQPDSGGTFGSDRSSQFDGANDVQLSRGKENLQDKELSDHKYPWEDEFSAVTDKPKGKSRAPLLLNRNGPSNPVFGTSSDDLEEVVL